jgi:hypothetical protein
MLTDGGGKIPINQINANVIKGLRTVVNNEKIQDKDRTLYNVIVC